jgi:hypothetical protein
MFLKDVGSAKDLLRCRSALFLKNINFLTVEDQQKEFTLRSKKNREKRIDFHYKDYRLYVLAYDSGS